MAGYYVVSQGEHVPGIAWNNGFSDYLTVWDHPNNADLKNQRQNPNVLLPGDRLFIPDRESGQFSGGTNQRHQSAPPVRYQT